MHILFLTDNFPPEVNAPASRTAEHCREWVRSGHRVTVITCVPNFPKGKIFDGYRNRLWQRETIDGIEVTRVWTYVAPNEGFFRRALDYASFMVAAALAAPFVRDVDIVVATSPQFFTACGGWLVSAMKRRPFVFELRDLWPESIRAVGVMKDGFPLRLLERMELFLYRRATAIITVTHSFRSILIDRGVNVDKIRVVTNGVDLDRFTPRPKDHDLANQIGLGNKLVIGYVGTHGLAHALHTILDAATLLKDDQEAKDVFFLLLGDGATKHQLKSEAERRKLVNVCFLDTVSKDEVVRFWSLIDISVIHLKNDPVFATVIPSKLFESMAMGIPVLLGVAGESARLVEKEQVGLVFDPENASMLADKILLLAADTSLRKILGEHGVRTSKQYQRKTLASDMLEVFEGLNASGATGHISPVRHRVVPVRDRAKY
jgi:glycosyltransferase involved in cell wall biosynthesis